MPPGHGQGRTGKVDAEDPLGEAEPEKGTKPRPEVLRRSDRHRVGDATQAAVTSAAVTSPTVLPSGSPTRNFRACST